MADVFTRAKRSEVMSLVKGRNTEPERVVRSLIHRMGFRFRVNVADLPGKPDIVLPRYRKVVFVHGCFWHGHKQCKRAGRPSTNKSFWDKKLDQNIDRDKRVKRELTKLGWQVLIVWQCQLRDTVRLKKKLAKFLEQ